MKRGEAIRSLNQLNGYVPIDLNTWESEELRELAKSRNLPVSGRNPENNSFLGMMGISGEIIEKRDKTLQLLIHPQAINNAIRILTSGIWVKFVEE